MVFTCLFLILQKIAISTDCNDACICDNETPSLCTGCRAGMINLATKEGDYDCQCDADSHFVQGTTQGTCVCDAEKHFVQKKDENDQIVEGQCMCDDGYEEDQSGACVLKSNCPVGCICQPSAPSTCSDCKPGFAKKTAEGSDAFTCECDADNHFVQGTTQGTCVCDAEKHFVQKKDENDQIVEGQCMCDDGYEEDQSGACVLKSNCPVGCICQPSAPSTCSDCKPGFAKKTAEGSDAFTCECDADNHFVQGTTQGTCVCDAEKHFVQKKDENDQIVEGQCMCDDGYEEDQSGACVLKSNCPVGCICQPSAPSTCSDCKPGFAKKTAEGSDAFTCECDADNHFVQGTTQGTCVCDAEKHFVQKKDENDQIVEGQCMCDDGYEEDQSGACVLKSNCPVGCICQPSAPSTCSDCKPGFAKKTAEGSDAFTCECDADNHFVQGTTQGTCVCDAEKHFVQKKDENDQIVEGQCMCDDGYEEDQSGACVLKSNCPVGCICQPSAPSTCSDCKPGFAKKTAEGSDAFTCECDADNHFVQGTTQGTCVCDAEKHFVQKKDENDQIVEGQCMCDDGYEEDQSGACVLKSNCPVGCICQPSAPSTCSDCKPGFAKKTAEGSDAFTCECDADNHFVQGTTQGTCVCDAEKHFVQKKDENDQIVEGQCMCDDGYEEDQSGACILKSNCPVGCICQPSAPSTCSDCKPGFAKKTAEGSDAFTCECDADNHFVQGTTQGTCVCDAEKHFVQKKDENDQIVEGQCMCDDGYEEDQSGACVLKSNCPVGCICQPSAPSTCSDCKPGFAKKTAEGSDAFTCECDADNHFVQGTTQGTCVCDAEKHFVQKKDENDQIVEGQCVCDDGYEEDQSGACILKSNCPVGCICQPSAPSTCSDCKPGFTKKTAEGSDAFTCECDADNHFVQGTTQGTCVCDAEKHFVQKKDENDQIVEGQCMCDDGYEEDQSGACVLKSNCPVGCICQPSAPSTCSDCKPGFAKKTAEGSDAFTCECDADSHFVQGTTQGTCVCDAEKHFVQKKDENDQIVEGQCMCDDGYEEDQSGACVLKSNCPVGCICQPSAPSTCSDCKPGFAKKTAEGSDAFTCECDADNHFVQGTTQGTCVCDAEKHFVQKKDENDQIVEGQCMCDDGYEEDQSGACVLKSNCPVGCICQPSAPSTCSDCKPGFAKKTTEGSDAFTCECDADNHFVQGTTQGTCVCDAEKHFVQKKDENDQIVEGQCVCDDGYEEDQSGACIKKDLNQCVPTIINCNTCIYENKTEKCTNCDNNYEPNHDGSACVQKQPLCVVGQNGCAKCDESLLLCLACEKEGYIVSGISCISPKCEVGKNNCTTCNENGSECQECIDPNYMITGIGCELNCSLINNCDKCYIDSNSGNQMKCNKCSNGFMPSDDYKSCVELNNCDIVGCLGCPANKTGFCYTCDTENHFIYDDSSNETYRKCICESGYELIQNKCIQKIEILPTPIVEEIKEKPDKFDTTDVNTGLQTINASDINNKNMSQKYVAELSPDAKSVEIQIPNNVNIEIVIPNTKSPNQPVIISAENDQTIVKINCKNDNGANLQLNNSASTEITGKGTITINPANTEETNNNQILEISKLIPSGEVNLASDKNVTFNELQVFDEKYVTGKAASENQIFKFNKVKIEQGGSLYPENLELHDIEIGVGAVLHYLDSCDFEKSDLTVYYNRTQSSQNPIIPILIESSSLPNSITARRKELGSFLEENEFIIAEANFGKQRNIKKVKDEANDENENVKKACEGWASKYKETDAQFNTVSCRYLPNEENIETIQLVASHKDKPKKKGLNGGAIAGIVIACVVVVAAIIALLVYFLVIKKHHESSSTAKDDSSIAI